MRLTVAVSRADTGWVPPLDDDLEALRALPAAIGAGPGVARGALEAVRSLAGAEAAVVWLRDPWDPDLATCHLLGAAGDPVHDLLVAEDPLLTRIVVDGPVLIADYAGSPLREPGLARAGVTSVAAAPIESEGRCLGAVAALRLDDGPPLDRQQLRLLRLAADQLGLALAARAARSDHAGALRRATRVAEAVVACGGALTLDGSLAAVADGARDVADAPFTAVLLAAPDGSLVRARAGQAAELLGDDDDEPLARLDEVFQPKHLARCLPLVHADAPRLLARLRPARRGVRRLAAGRVRFAVAVPIAVGGAVVGCLLVGCDRPHPDPATFEPLVTLAASAGAALRRSRLLSELEQASAEAVGALAAALVAPGSADGLAGLALQVGRAMRLGPEALRDLELAAELHELAGGPRGDELLAADGTFSKDERAFLRQHAGVAERLLGGAPELSGAARALRSARERWDGSGGPDGLAHESIPLLARILRACATWHALVDAGADEHAALVRLRADAGRRLDPRVVDALAALAA
jgi:GAF domain-containing protein